MTRALTLLSRALSKRFEYTAYRFAADFSIGAWIGLMLNGWLS